MTDKSIRFIKIKSSDRDKFESWMGSQNFSLNVIISDLHESTLLYTSDIPNEGVVALKLSVPTLGYLCIDYKDPHE